MKRSIASTLFLLSFGLHASDSKLELRHREAKGVGYDKGYSTVEYLFTRCWGKPELLINLRGHVFNDGKLAGNAGIGYRHGFKNDAYRCGINFFYDFRDTKHFFANQAGAGLEFLSKHFDFRMNGYLPFGKTKTFEKREFDGFSGNHILIKQKLAGALPSAEAELGFPLTRSLYLAGGPYYLFEQNAKGVHLGSAWGGKVRVAIDIDRYFTLGGIATHDPIFKTTVQGYLSFKLPLGGKWAKKDSVRQLCTVPIWRNEIIPIEKKKRQTALYFGEEENDQIGIMFVNNLASLGGNGSFEAPFSSLKEAEAASKPGDIIYVFPGDGTPRNLDEGIILKEDQMIASSGAPLVVEEIVIPPMTPGENPVITNIHPDQPVVANPGNSHLDDFRIIQPWEYFFEDWDFNLGGGGNNGGGNGAAGVGGIGGFGAPPPPPPGLGAFPPDGSEDGDAVIVDPVSEDGSDNGAVIVDPIDDGDFTGSEDGFEIVGTPQSPGTPPIGVDVEDGFVDLGGFGNADGNDGGGYNGGWGDGDAIEFFSGSGLDWDNE